MSFTCKLQVNGYGNAINISASRTFTGESQTTLAPTIPASTTNQQILLAIDISLLKLLVIKSDQNISIKTNSSSTPDNTLNIVANVPYTWGDGDYNAKLLTADVESIFVTNATTSPANVEILALVDL
jgi:hypothetical protein